MLIHLIQSYGYLGIFILMALESACIPIPSEITMPFGGFLASQGTLSLPIVIVVGALGNLVGSLVAYYIGRVLEENVLVDIIRRYGKFVLVNESDYFKANVWFKKYGSGTVFVSRLLPAVRTFISLPAGVFKMDLAKFVLYTFIGSLLWSALLAYLGFYLGNSWETVGPIVSKLQYAVIVVVIIAVGYYVYRKLQK